MQVVEFLTEIFNSGQYYSAINTARSALSVILSDEKSNNIGKGQFVKRFMKGVLELRPPMARYDYIWDGYIVLDFLRILSPYEEIPLSHLTYELVMLIALCSAQRAQTIHALNLDTFIFSKELVIIPLHDFLKQTTVRNRKFSVHLRAYKDDPEICVLNCLKEKLKKNQSFEERCKKVIY